MVGKHLTEFNRLVRWLLVSMPGILLVFGCLSTFVATYYIYRTAYEQKKTDFEYSADQVITRITDYTDTHMALLYSSRGLFSAQNEITAANFKQFTGQIPFAQRYAGIQGVGYIASMSPTEIATILGDRVRVHPATPQEKQYIALFVEPDDARNRALVGLNFYAEPERRTALVKARDTGEPIVSNKLELKVEGEKDSVPGGFMVLAVYDTPLLPATIEERQEHLRGFVFTQFEAYEFLTAAFGTQPPQNIGFSIYDGSRTDETALLFSWQKETNGNPTYQSVRTVTIDNHDWTFAFYSTLAEGESSRGWLGPMVLVTGLVLSLSMYQATRHQTQARMHAETAQAQLSISKAELETSEERLRLLIEGAKDYAILMLNSRGSVISWNVGAQNLLGYTEREVLHKRYNQFFSSRERRANFYKELQRAQREGSYQFERQFTRKDGTTFWASGVLTPLFESPERGKLKGFALIARDVTLRKENEKKLEMSQALNAAILSSLSASLAVLDEYGNVMQTNAAWDQTMQAIHKNRPELEAAAGNYLDWWRQQASEFPAAVPIIGGIVAVLKEKKQRYMFEYSITIEDKTKWTLLSVTPLQHTDGSAVVSLTDITAGKKLEQQKEDFLSIASHELKTPITSTKAYVQVLKKLFARKGETNAVDLAQRMDSQLDRVTRLINELLDVSKIEAGKLRLNRETFDFDALLHEVVELIQMTSDTHRLIIDSTVDIAIHSDRERLSQVITNLLTNAIKYSPDADRVLISCKRTRDRISCSVQDFGVGISAEQQKKLFERFYRVPGKQETFPGLGLGLFISAQIIKRLGGVFNVESEVGKGSIFTFEIPIHTQAA